MQIANYERTLIALPEEFNKYPRRDIAITEIRKKGRKHGYRCPFCNEYLILRAGSTNEPHFSHKQGKSCTVARSYEQYEKQVKRESVTHSVIRDVIYDDLRNQQRFKADLNVEHGYHSKAESGWKVVPDLVVKKGDSEFGISILTNVYQKGDDALVKTIRKRNLYFSEKGLNNIWFIEDQELSLDLTHRVMFLWESETLLSSKTAWDHKWDELLNRLSENGIYSISEVLNYNEKQTLHTNVQSLYYVHSTTEGITFTVHRVILDELEPPFRALAVNTGYKMQLTEALIIQEHLRLSDDDFEQRQMNILKSDFAKGINCIKQTYEGSPKNSVQLNSVEMPVSQISKQDNSHKDLPVIYWDDGTIIYLIKRLKSKFISLEDVSLLAQYLRHNRELVVFKGWDLREIKQLALDALGKIEDPQVRIYLMEIKDM